LPSMAEIRDPSRWTERAEGLGRTA
jgi:hypothetical protein